jgi:hypothetical protein
MDNLDKNCFAYPSMRKYPVHTKEAALNSWADFCGEKDTIPGVIVTEITDVFNKAAAFHEITLDPIVKEASVEPELVHFGTEDAGISMSKISSATDVEAAATFILHKRASMSREQLAEAAKYTLWCASNMDVPIESDAMKKIACIAGVGVGDRAEIQTEFEKRATMNLFEGQSKEAFWNYVNEMKAMSDEEFYKEANLNAVCNALEGIDTLYDNTHRYGHDLKRPEEVCFGQGMDDLLKEASDLAYIESIDTTISKSALFERRDAVNSFFQNYMGIEKPLEDDALLAKVASLDAAIANALLESID